jgi:hypothetical protein
MTKLETDEVVEVEDAVELLHVEGERLPAVVQHEAIVARAELSVDEVVEQKDKIKQVMQRVMTSDVHYGIIPGTDKPTLLKPGAEAINVALRLAPHYDSEKLFTDDGHLTVVTKCTLEHIPTRLVVGTGEGLATTKEAKYAYRNAKRKCPVCGQESIIKGKAEYGGGWVCWKREGGCGENFYDDDARITGQEIGKITNPDLPDSWNTVLKMADKRALIAAVLNATAASDVFTQDLEDEPSADTPPSGGAVRAASSGNLPAGGGDPNAVGLSPGRAAGQPGGIARPGSWKAIEKLVLAYDPATWEAFQAFGGQARRYLFGDEAELEQKQKDELFQATSLAAMYLREAHDPEQFPPPTRDDIRAAWAVVLEGTELEGPAWRMSPDEEDRPAHGEAADAPAG